MDELLLSQARGDYLSAAPGIVVGILMIIAAILWFSPGARWRLRRLTLLAVVAAVAAIVIFGYLRPLLGTGGGS